MSYWIYLKDKNGGTVEVDSHAEGASANFWGSPRATLNVTVNYRALFNFNSLYGLTGQESIAHLREAVLTLGTQKDDNHWGVTFGNVGHHCSILLEWAENNPQAVWDVHS